MKEISTGIQALLNGADATQPNAVLTGFFLQRAQSLVVNLPPFKNCEDYLAGKPGARELAEDAGSLFPVFRLLQPFATQIFTRLLFLVPLVINRRNRLINHLSVDSFYLQIGNHAHAPEFFVVAAE